VITGGGGGGKEGRFSCNILCILRRSGSCSFPQTPKIIFAFSFLKVHLHNSSKIKSHKEVTSEEIKVFLLFFCLLMEGSGSGDGSVQINTDPDPEGQKRPKVISVGNFSWW
jgi:hypothetical protein